MDNNRYEILPAGGASLYFFFLSLLFLSLGRALGRRLVRLVRFTREREEREREKRERKRKNEEHKLLREVSLFDR